MGSLTRPAPPPGGFEGGPPGGGGGGAGGAPLPRPMPGSGGGGGGAAMATDVSFAVDMESHRGLRRAAQKLALLELVRCRRVGVV